MSKISIVTAFYDIGRGSWTPDKGLPHYLQRSNDVYIERFKHLLKLDNEIIVYTSPDLSDVIKSVCLGRPNTKVIAMDIIGEFHNMRAAIEKIQKSTDYQSMINPSQIKNPEYWNPDYVLVTNLKAYFVNHAINNYGVENDMVAWIDFGYCRSESNIPESKTWQYDFDQDLIHMFCYKHYDNRVISEIIANNDVYILGAKVVAHKKNWPKLAYLMTCAFNQLYRNGMVDDDQGLWLISYLLQPKIFSLHPIPDHQLGHDPFVLFNEFNTTCQK